MKPTPIIVKKYGNRRLYDTNNSRYINLEDIAGMVRQGEDVHVVDAKTGRDLTRVTLTQIITEDAKGRPTGLPLELLRQLIMASDQVRQEFVMWYLKSAFETYEQVQSAVQNRLTEVGSAILSPMETMKRFLSAPRPEADSEIAALRKRVAELEARLAPTPQRRRKREKR